MVMRGKEDNCHRLQFIVTALTDVGSSNTPTIEKGFPKGLFLVSVDVVHTHCLYDITVLWAHVCFDHLSLAGMTNLNQNSVYVETLQRANGTLKIEPKFEASHTHIKKIAIIYISMFSFRFLRGVHMKDICIVLPSRTYPLKLLLATLTPPSLIWCLVVAYNQELTTSSSSVCTTKQEWVCQQRRISVSIQTLIHTQLYMLMCLLHAIHTILDHVTL